jgi:UDP-glucose 4-epimerase
LSLSKPLFQLLSIFWPMARWVNPLLRRKPFNRIFAPAFSGKYNHAVILPIQQDIPIPANSILPRKLLETLVEQSSSRVVMNSCLCRTVEGCDDFPLDLGCLFLGDGADQIHSSMAQRISREEALAHINRGLAMSLSPTIIHSWFDAAVLGIDYRKMLGICFCCPCCCTLQRSVTLGPDTFQESVKPIPGIKVEITSDCIGCGTCVETCAFQAIELHSPAAIITSRCKACGRCVDICPHQAIKMEIETNNSDIDLLMMSIQSRSQIS